ncbi:high nitrogen upregulated cytochrome P450 monooxygenase 2 [Cerioporus squamosus]|nr:high nitrogen upregulated cytochrome P450 monooxygenase 2 [Cerioporus squamosus]
MSVLSPGVASSSQSILDVGKYTVPLALVGHQIFRRRETYSILSHAAILFAPPITVAVWLWLATLIQWTFQDALRACLGTYLTTLVLSVLAYRLSPFHPLAQYPGPVWRRISMLGPALHSTRGTTSRYMKQLHDHYGDVVRIGEMLSLASYPFLMLCPGPNEVSIRDHTAVSALLGPGGLAKGPSWVGGMLSAQNLPMVGIQDIDEHLARRRAWNRGLSPTALKDYEPAIAAQTRQLLQALDSQDGCVIFGDWFKSFSLDLISDMVFGRGADLLRDGDHSSIWRIIEDGMIFATFFAKVPWLGVYVGRIPGAARPLQTLHAISRKLVSERLKIGTKSRDLFHYLSNEDLENKDPPPNRQLMDDGVLAVVASTDAVSSALTALFYCLLTHREVYNALQQEVDEFYPDGEDVGNTKHYRDMQYLHAVINETLRLYPPVPGGGQRQVPRDSAPVAVGSICLPPGTIVRIPPFSLHRDGRNFSLPECFWPERWLVSSGKISLSDARHPDLEGQPSTDQFVHNEAAFIPFFHGPMNCPGKGLALLEISMLVCALLQHFSIRLQPGWDKERFNAELRDYFDANRPELPVVLERRR